MMKSVYITVFLALLEIAAGHLSALDRMMNVRTMDEFLSLLRKQGRPVTEYDIYSRHASLSGPRVSARGGYIAVPDNCSPREMTVDLDIGDAEPDTVYYPRCTKVARCGGCCSGSHFSCEPDRKERTSLNVVKGQVPFPGSDFLVFNGFQRVPVEVHLSCRVRCNLSQEKCGSRKTFLPHQCACTCAHTARCLGSKIWDAEQCDCVCAKTRKCSRGQVFSQNSCQCEDDHGRLEVSLDDSSSTTYIRKNSDQPLAGAGRERDFNIKKSPPIPTTRPVATTPETAKEAAAPTTNLGGECASLHCPPKFTPTKRWDLCVCDPVPGSAYFLYRRRHRYASRPQAWRQPRRMSRRKGRKHGRMQNRRGR